MKTLTIDIETTPNLAYVWSLWRQNVALNQIHSTGEVMAFAAKWSGEDEVIFRSTFHDGKKRMLKEAHRLLSAADVVVTFNGVKFDLPWLRTEFLLAGMKPPSTWVDVDLLPVVQRHFRFPSNRLAYVSKALELGDGKMDAGGFDLWVDCLAGDPDAWAKMRAYNKQDVVVTELLHEKLRPYMPRHPNPALYADAAVDRCACGSDRLQRRGFAYTNLSKYQRYQCRDCGRWMRGARRLAGVDARGAA